MKAYVVCVHCGVMMHLPSAATPLDKCACVRCSEKDGLMRVSVGDLVTMSEAGWPRAEGALEEVGNELKRREGNVHL